MKPIGIYGPSGSGKDTLAGMLADRLDGGDVYSFASALKRDCYYNFGNVNIGIFNEDYYNKNRAERYKPLANGKTPVEIWCEYGNFMRGVYPDIWVHRLWCSVEFSTKVAIIPDLRFKNEYDWIASQGGTLIKITRDGSGHSQASMDGQLEDCEFDYVIDNNGSLSDLEDRVVDIVKEMA